MKINKLLGAIFLLLAVFPIALLGAIKNFTVGGPDFTVYGIYVWNNFINQGAFLNHLYPVEFGYNLFNFLVSRLTSNPHVYLLFYGLTIYTLFYLFLRNFRPQYTTINWFLFLAIFFYPTMNFYRQFLAISIFLFGFSLNEKYKKTSYLIIFSSFFFHNSMLIGVLLIFINIFSKRTDLLKKFRTLILAAFAFVYFFGNVLANYFVTHIGVFARYMDYLSSTSLSSQGSLFSALGIRLIPLVFILVVYLKSTVIDDRKKNGFLVICLLIEIATLPLRNISESIVRMFLVFSIFKIFSLSSILPRFNKSTRILAYLFLVSYAILFIQQTISPYSYCGFNFFDSINYLFN